MAFGLANALGLAAELGPEIKTRIDARDNREALHDFQQGDVDEDRGGTYSRAQSRLRANADWITDEAEFSSELDALDWDNTSPDELDGAINELYQAKYGGLDDADQIELLAPKMAEFREAAQTHLVEYQQERIVEQQNSDLRITAQADYDAAVANGSVMDVHALHGTTRELYSGAQTNEVVYGIMRDIAIRNGDPDLFTTMPDRWEDGTPTFKSIPAWADRILDTEAKAEAQQRRIQAEVAREDAAAHTAAENAAKLDIMGSILNGDPVEDKLEQFVAAGYDADSVMPMYRAMTSVRDTQEDRAGDYHEVSLLEVSIARGDGSINDVVDAYNLGHFGEGKAAREEMSRLISLADRAASSSASDNNAVFATYRDFIPKHYNDSPDGIFTLPEVTNLQARAMVEYRQLVHEEGIPPRDAAMQVMDKYDPEYDRIKQRAEDQRPLAPDEAVAGFANGTMSLQMLQETVTPDALHEMNEAGRLTPQQFAYLVNALDRDTVVHR